MRSTFLRDLALPLLCLLAAFVVLLLLVPFAHAQASPSEVALVTADTAWDLVEQHGPIWGGMLIVFGVGSAFLKRNDKEGWLKQGRVLAIVVGALGVLGSVLEAGVNDGTWAGVIVTVVAAVKMILSPTVGSPATAKKLTLVSFVSLVLLVALSGFGCKPYLPPAAHPFVDCVNADQARVKSLLDDFWPDGGGKPDFGEIEAKAIDAGVSIGSCAIASFVQKYLAPPPGTAVPPPELAHEAHQLLERARTRAGGASFRFADGDY